MNITEYTVNSAEYTMNSAEYTMNGMYNEQYGIYHEQYGIYTINNTCISDSKISHHRAPAARVTAHYESTLVYTSSAQQIARLDGVSITLERAGSRRYHSYCPEHSHNKCSHRALVVYQTGLIRDGALFQPL